MMSRIRRWTERSKNALRQTLPYRIYQRRRLLSTEVTKFREWTGEDERRHNFYRQFIEPGDLVFDVGANIGNRSKVFLKLGARVVAFEPQQNCADFLTLALGAEPKFTLVRQALGATSGTGEMHINDAHFLSTMSTDWMEATRASGRFEGHDWQVRQVVQIETLDSMIDKFGVPRFLKIDVEGFEKEVLLGLSRQIEYISFEYTPERLEEAFECMKLISREGPAEFQLALGEEMQFQFTAWMKLEPFHAELSRLTSTLYGDIYARKPAGESN